MIIDEHGRTVEEANEQATEAFERIREKIDSYSTELIPISSSSDINISEEQFGEPLHKHELQRLLEEKMETYTQKRKQAYELLKQAIVESNANQFRFDSYHNTDSYIYLPEMEIYDDYDELVENVEQERISSSDVNMLSGRLSPAAQFFDPDDYTRTAIFSRTSPLITMDDINNLAEYHYSNDSRFSARVYCIEIVD